ncbi:hypothetical protein [Arenimonas sp.]|uniref:hypothetical protein n=1 Tax=Arenimonas sp. TaxID=1872635 RepID=UPI002E30C257|nr:hypothetical protein [Arenimonas sp.]HEX4853787.1 hypothetical protein [Arenimonas sp.]
MTRGRGAIALATLLLAGTAAASDPTPVAYLRVIDPGCSSGADAPAATRWERPGQAVHSLTVWMNSRESIATGPVEVEVEADDGRVVAWVPVQLASVTAGEPVATCIRPVSLELSVSPLAEGEYAWELRRGSRAEDATQAAAAAAEAAPAPVPAPDAAD